MTNKNVFEKFDEKIDIEMCEECGHHIMGRTTYKAIKSHFHQDYKDIIAELEGEKLVENPNKIIPTDVHTHNIGYNQALEVAIQIIKSRLPNQEDE